MIAPTVAVAFLAAALLGSSVQAQAAPVAMIVRLVPAEVTGFTVVAEPVDAAREEFLATIDMLVELTHEYESMRRSRAGAVAQSRT